MKFIFLILFLQFSFGVANGQNNQAIETTDIDHFWIAFDGLKNATNKSDSLNIIQTKYLDKSSKFFKEFIRVRNLKADEYLTIISKYPKFWESIRVKTQKIKDRKDEIVAIFDKYEKAIPNFKRPNVCFAIGCLRTGGTVSKNLILIGTEIAASTPETDKSELTPWLKSVIGTTGDIGAMVSHETIHTQQSGGHLRDLVEFSISEGVADFLGEQISGYNINKNAYRFGAEHDCALRKEFLADYAKDKNDISKWLYSGNKALNRPADLGYYIGYQIAKEYYTKAIDKRKAITELLNRKNYKKMFRKSDYIKKTCD